MANPQPDQFTKISNELLEAFARVRIAGNEWQILAVILRKTYGYLKTSDTISISQFQKMTQLDRRNIFKLLKALQNRNIISIVHNDASNITRYSVQKNYENWRVVSKKTLAYKQIKTSVHNDNETSVHNDAHKRKKEIQKKEHLGFASKNSEQNPVGIPKQNEEKRFAFTPPKEEIEKLKKKLSTTI